MQTFKVDGMTCGHCERTITDALLAIDPHAQIKVDLAGGEVKVKTTHPVDQVLTTIIEAGYKAEALPTR